MSEACCSDSGSADGCAVPEPDAGASACAACGEAGTTVDSSTVAALTRGQVANKQRFWLCRDANCETAYYGEWGARFVVADLHVTPGFKTPSEHALLCYCFMHSRGEIEQELRASGETSVPRRITEQIRAGNCACEVRNPAGRCCLGEVNSAVAMIRDRLTEVVT